MAPAAATNLPSPTIMLLLYVLMGTLVPWCVASSSESLRGRYSFSLSTFDPSGRLAQVEHASTAASLGPPVAAVALASGRGAVAASLFASPGPLVDDDGTARFVRITDSIAVAHSGVSADGRAVVSAAQRMAIEYGYTFDGGGDTEGGELPIDVFLEEVSDLFQRYTMKAGCRPFGCSLLVLHLPASPALSGRKDCRIYRIDPSGSVEMAGPICCIGGGDDRAPKIVRALEERGCSDAASLEEAEEIMLEVLRDVLGSSPVTKRPRLSFLCSSMTRSGGLSVRKVSSPTRREGGEG